MYILHSYNLFLQLPWPFRQEVFRMPAVLMGGTWPQKCSLFVKFLIPKLQGLVTISLIYTLYLLYIQSCLLIISLQLNGCKYISVSIKYLTLIYLKWFFFLICVKLWNAVWNKMLKKFCCLYIIIILIYFNRYYWC